MEGSNVPDANPDASGAHGYLDCLLEPVLCHPFGVSRQLAVLTRIWPAEYGETRYAGADGFFSVSAERGASIEAIAAAVAGHKLRTPIASDLTESTT